MTELDRYKAGGDCPRLYVYNSGFLTQTRLRRILGLAGYKLRLGLPGEGDMVGVWGNSPTAHRGLSIAAKRDAPVLRVEDTFLRSLHPGRAGEPPIGLNLDRSGVHFDPATVSDLEYLLTTAPLDDTHLLNRARDAMTRLRESHLSKYNAFDPSVSPPEPGYVLVVDQARGDASVSASTANDVTFREMLVFAQEEHPGARVVIKTHPETQSGYRSGYFSQDDANRRVTVLDTPVSPWALLDGAVGVYTVSSQLGFEAIIAGHKPRIFGQPFYSGWGLTRDEYPVPRRERVLTRAQLFAAAMILYPKWYDPFRDALCELETVLDNIEAQTRAWRQDHNGWVASGMRMWKRRSLQKMFGRERRVIFTDDPQKLEKSDRPLMVWANKAQPDQSGITRVEDGFIRSRGLGAELVPPLSLVTDDHGIYYDPTTPSQLEERITARQEMRPAQHQRAERLIASLAASHLSKYNQGEPPATLPRGHRILVPGQVEDDASIRLGAGVIHTNQALLQAVRDENPDAIILYKPHPDVEAGLRPGAIEAGELADEVLNNTDPAHILDQVQEVWTMTSLLGFEALLRGVPVTTLGAPFYAGWGLTRDLGDIPPRRTAQPALTGLVHAVLIDYPRYMDPVTGRPCPVEVVVDRLASGTASRRGIANRSLSKLQGLFATYAHLWR